MKAPQTETLKGFDICGLFYRMAFSEAVALERPQLPIRWFDQPRHERDLSRK